ncbi:hypothetical protein EDD18DRAFT_1109804 [Armillaria luteobubalina]|uniref:Uncharacterized protein n=1 Tax=Armillaria luteobubalina TaxID=153913 RepID=A0AA39PT54_9AGAR|nr:hypothetical protein EDD18DRAFT_1109804 [Armillaria luteobubalina]
MWAVMGGGKILRINTVPVPPKESGKANQAREGGPHRALRKLGRRLGGVYYWPRTRSSFSWYIEAQDLVPPAPGAFILVPGSGVKTRQQSSSMEEKYGTLSERFGPTEAHRLPQCDLFFVGTRRPSGSLFHLVTIDSSGRDSEDVCIVPELLGAHAEPRACFTYSMLLNNASVFLVILSILNLYGNLRK